MMHEKHILEHIKHECHKQERVCDWDFIATEVGSIRVYYKPRDEQNGFDFCALEWCGVLVCESTNDGEMNWHHKHCQVADVFHGIAYFDGIRHLYYGSDQTDNYGYHYYANLPEIINAMQILRELELKYCRDAEK